MDSFGKSTYPVATILVGKCTAWQVTKRDPMRSKHLSPTEALRVLTEHFRVPPSVTRRLTPGHHGFLADEIEIEAVGYSLVNRNGYALPIGFAGGECRFISRPMEELERQSPMPAVGSEGPAEGTSAELAALPLILRVESGDPLPRDCDRILPVYAARVTGTGTITVEPEAIPEQGYGVEASGALRLDPGSELDTRTVALLLAHGSSEVSLFPPLEIGVGCIGSELVDAEALSSLRPDGERARVADITGAWLDDAIRKLGHVPQPLGTLPDAPEEILRSLRRAERLGLKTVVLSGGLGDGFEDRTIETLESGPFRIFFSGNRLLPGQRFLFAQGLGVDLLVLGGAPLDAAVNFDLLVAPCLLRARGAPETEWNWTRGGPMAGAAAAELEHSPVLDDRGEEMWTVGPIRRGDEFWPASTRSFGSLSRFSPGVPSQWGWWLRSPTPDEAIPERRERYYRVPARR